MALCVLAPCAGEESMRVGDSTFGVRLSFAEGVVRESGCESSGTEVLDCSGSAWALETGPGVVSPSAGECRLIHGDSRRAEFEGITGGMAWRLTYQSTGSGRVTKSLVLTPSRNTLIKRVSMWNASSKLEPLIARTSLQDIAAFYRNGERGVFVSLDFPFSDIGRNEDLVSVSYPPFVELSAGQSYSCHSLTLGSTRLTGISRYGYDDGEVDAMDSYVQERFKPRFSRPMFVSTCINNRYTQLGGGAVFYTMKDHPTLSFNPDLLKREIALMPQFGMEYYQVWTGPFDSVPNDPDPDHVKSMVAYGRKLGVRLGDYSGCGGMFCIHYNEYNKSLADYPEWGLTNSDVCFGNPKFVDFYIDQVVPNCRNYGFQIHCLDFLDIHQCDDPSHGHAPGRDSIYAQVLGLKRMLDGLSSVSPDMMTWSNSGNWGQFLPKIAWSNQNLYLTDPFIATEWQGLNMTRLLDDARREQMVSLHYSTFIPYRFLSNCQYFFSQNSVTPDTRSFEYGALSTIAVTPNLSLGEVRPWYDSLNAPDQACVRTFYKRWTDFLKKNYKLWEKTYSAGENPGMGSVEVYGHASGSSGYVFIVNPQYWGRTVAVPLGTRLGFCGTGKVEVKELYPTQRLRLTAQGPFANLGETIPVHVEPHQVLVLQVSPAPKTIGKPRLYGLPGSVEPAGDGYLLKTTGPQGQLRRCVVLLPNGSEAVVSAKVRPDMPKQPKRLWSPTPVKIAGSSKDSVTLDLTFRRDPAPTELRDWKVKPGDLAAGTSAGWQKGLTDTSELRLPLFVDVDDAAVRLPMWTANAESAGLGPLADFCGAYVDNAFQEDQETLIDLQTAAIAVPQPGETGSGERLAPRRTMPAEAKDKTGGWWLQTSFHLPFMYWSGGSEPRSEDHTLLVLPFVRKDRVKQIKAWINGEPIEIRDYRYPRNRKLGCFYVDLVGTAARGGENTVVMHFEAP